MTEKDLRWFATRMAEAIENTIPKLSEEDDEIIYELRMSAQEFRRMEKEDDNLRRT